MKIKPPIYLAAAGAGVLSLLAGPYWLGQQVGLALGFALLLFGLYGLSRGVPGGGENGKEEGDGNI